MTPNSDQQPLGRNALAAFKPVPSKPKVNSHGQEDMESVDEDDIGGGAWKNSKTPLLAVALEFDDRNAPSVLYGSIVGGVYHDPSRGIQFVFEALHCVGWDDWRPGLFKVTVLGSNLEGVRNRLNAGTRAVIRENRVDVEGDEKRPPVTIGKITVDGPIALAGPKA